MPLQLSPNRAGMKILCQSFLSNTHKIKLHRPADIISACKCRSKIKKFTNNSVLSGIRYAAQGSIDGAYPRVERRTGQLSNFCNILYRTDYEAGMRNCNLTALWQLSTMLTDAVGKNLLSIKAFHVLAINQSIELRARYLMLKSIGNAMLLFIFNLPKLLPTLLSKTKLQF